MFDKSIREARKLAKICPSCAGLLLIWKPLATAINPLATAESPEATDDAPLAFAAKPKAEALAFLPTALACTPEAAAWWPTARLRLAVALACQPNACAPVADATDRYRTNRAGIGKVTDRGGAHGGCHGLVPAREAELLGGLRLPAEGLRAGSRSDRFATDRGRMEARSIGLVAHRDCVFGGGVRQIADRDRRALRRDAAGGHAIGGGGTRADRGRTERTGVGRRTASQRLGITGRGAGNEHAIGRAGRRASQQRGNRQSQPA